MTETVVRPKSLNRPVRFFVKETGKKVMRWIAGFQARMSRVPDAPFLDAGLFPHLKPFETDWERIRDELSEIMKHPDAIPGFEEVSPDQYKIARDRKWRTFILYGFGDRLETNCERAPHTAALLSRVPNIRTAWFSILAPGYHIPAHTGVTKGILRAHLGLVIPERRELCRIRVGEQVRSWKAGEVIVLDDTYDHEVWNETDEERVVLLFDFDRPMRWPGRALNAALMHLIKLTAFYREPKRNLEALEAAARRADATLERLGE
ncbi:MAG: aspartyl/asparaginyl beta-hydroxylase domain-containing protein [Pseudomonadota bacterium]